MPARNAGAKRDCDCRRPCRCGYRTGQYMRIHPRRARRNRRSARTARIAQSVREVEGRRRAGMPCGADRRLSRTGIIPRRRRRAHRIRRIPAIAGDLPAAGRGIGKSRIRCRAGISPPPPARIHAIPGLAPRANRQSAHRIPQDLRRVLQSLPVLFDPAHPRPAGQPAHGGNPRRSAGPHRWRCP
ncbi:MAG: hypothetical protein BWY59_01125 [Verrucomicrobia bacterium ADurb.Bin345]|nr:MAG: hypothetical protein BWY59_01125 [Verrucomicrobia bacterium ADurb.Bin345]